ncbi:MAG: DNA adenine methylase [Bacteroidia bacterium]|nr:DNA adenine methylase [Bacteroidia bacterium]
MKKKEFESEISTSEQEKKKHLNRQIIPEAHTPMYNFHKYWSRKTWNVVGEYIKTYCPEGGIVLDPFGGSGVTAMEAIKAGRKVIIADINPIATEITRLTIKPVSLLKLEKAFQKIEKKVSKKIKKLYLTRCRKCKAELSFDCAIWNNGQCTNIRYSSCPCCGDSQTGYNPLDKSDRQLIRQIDKHKIKEWFPKNPLYHINGNPFKEKQKFESINELYTKRNLYALAILMNDIEKEPSREIRAFLKIGFSSMVHLCSSMTPVRPTRPMSSAWTQHSYWYANEFMEQNVWNKFESAIIGKQGLIKAKTESNEYYEKVKFGRSFRDVVEGDANAFIYNGSWLDLMKEMKKRYGEHNCIDYIFTDPPYDQSIQYGELSFQWVAWLKMDKGYLEKIDSDEIIHNEKQNKDFEVYNSLLRESFRGMFDVLKPDAYLTLTFHNPSFKVRNTTIRTGIFSGFEFDKIHHQELAHPSPKALLQPFGSAQGDFYLRFHKPSFGTNGVQTEKIDELRFEKIVLDTTVKILAERGEPTPYTIIINAIDPELAKRGYFSELNSGLNIEQILRRHIDNEFIFVEGKIGGAAGKLWWFKNPSMVKHLEKIPLSERVEQTVLRQLQSKGKVTFTEIWEAISTAFPNSLTSDQTSIKTALEDYARPVEGGAWLIKQNFKPGFVEKEHTTIIALLAETGVKAGYKIHIGKIEQNHEIDTSRIKKTGKLKQFVSFDNPVKLTDIQNPKIVGDIDLLWINNYTVEYAFEVECTTSMTSALQRGSNLKNTVKKVMLLPVDRMNQFERKMKSPLFNEYFSRDNWNFILFDVLYKQWDKDKANTIIDDLFGKASTLKKTKMKDQNQLGLFEDNTG